VELRENKRDSRKSARRFSVAELRENNRPAGNFVRAEKS
jgi:hypothetical protein